ncbi:hypothetical protein CYY_004986 [Polysphondylium violaceum]|uniref:Uncharacterized protein n=1 Tax=Polysphondylium violaceum TaxID=133409 RepID=A0A8J4PSG8_9MYCE|nr:hypothetical protein CYY_004986 [Polysphondylium violaceum]
MTIIDNLMKLGQALEPHSSHDFHKMATSYAMEFRTQIRGQFCSNTILNTDYLMKTSYMFGYDNDYSFENETSTSNKKPKSNIGIKSK